VDLDQVSSSLNAGHGIGMREIHTGERNFDLAGIFSFVRAVSAVYREHGVLVFLTTKEYHHEVSIYRSRRRIDCRACSRHLQCIA
jgi:hypothetical protein